MSRYVDVENLDFIAYKGIPNGYNDSFDSGVLYAMNLIDKQPTADVVLVAHGHWIQMQDKDENGNAYYSCSVCGSGECHVPEINVPYCWKCGSKMDEVTE